MSEIYYEEKGERSKPSLILIHAFPLTRKMWEEQMEPLSKQFHVVRYDVRGFGNSTDTHAQITFEQHADDLLSLIQKLQLNKPILCGLSMGGYIALRFCERHPEAVGGLILADTKAEADGNEAKIKRAQGVQAIMNQGLVPFLEGFVKGAISSHSAEARPSLPETIKALALENSPLFVSSALIAMAGRSDTTEALKKFEFPVLIIVGKEDKLTPVEQSEKMKSFIPQAKLVVIPQVGHLSNLEAPQAFNEAVLWFLRS